MVGPVGHRIGERHASSMMSAPASTSACISGTVRPGSGSPAVMNGNQRLAALAVQAFEKYFECATSELDPRLFGHGMHVLVTAPGEVDQQNLVLPSVGASLAA